MGQAIRRQLMCKKQDQETQTEPTKQRLKPTTLSSDDDEEVSPFSHKRTAAESFSDSCMFYDAEFMIDYVKAKRQKIVELQLELEQDLKKISEQVNQL